MSKRVANKKGEHQGARSGRVRLGHWRLRQARLRAERAAKERDAMRVANQMAAANRTSARKGAKPGFMAKIKTFLRPATARGR